MTTSPPSPPEASGEALNAPIPFYQWLAGIEKDVRVHDLTPLEIAGLIRAVTATANVDAVRGKLTAEYLAMTPLQKWDTLTLHGLLGTDEPWIEDMRETLRGLETPPTSVDAVERVALIAELRNMVFAPSSIINDHTSTITLSQHRRIIAALASPVLVGRDEELLALRSAGNKLLVACYLADAHEELSFHVDGSLLDGMREALELQYPIIWTQEQVDALNAWQVSGANHPYTCGGERGDEAHTDHAEENGEDNGQLVATQRGWVCPVCDYRQFWAHEFSFAKTETPTDTKVDHE